MQSVYWQGRGKTQQLGQGESLREKSLGGNNSSDPSPCLPEKQQSNSSRAKDRRRMAGPFSEAFSAQLFYHLGHRISYLSQE